MELPTSTCSAAARPNPPWKYSPSRQRLAVTSRALLRCCGRSSSADDANIVPQDSLTIIEWLWDLIFTLTPRRSFDVDPYQGSFEPPKSQPERLLPAVSGPVPRDGPHRG